MIEHLSEATRERLNEAARVIIDAGGEIVGRTRLQKTVFLLKLAGYEVGFAFDYKHYGPYSEGLAETAEVAAAFKLMSETQRRTGRGVFYSTYKAEGMPSDDETRVALTRAAAHSSAVLLELAATAAYVAKVEGRSNPWAETEELKPEKAAEGRLGQARTLYAQLRTISENRLPDIGDK